MTDTMEAPIALRYRISRSGGEVLEDGDPTLVPRLRAFIDAGLPYHAIADKLGISQHGVQNMCRRNGIVSRRAYLFGQPAESSPERLAILVNFDLRPAERAELLGITVSELTRRLSRVRKIRALARTVSRRKADAQRAAASAPAPGPARADGDAERSRASPDESPDDRRVTAALLASVNTNPFACSPGHSAGVDFADAVDDYQRVLTRRAREAGAQLDLWGGSVG